MSACPAKKADGKPCGASPQKGRTWCYFHDPEVAEARSASQARGGAMSRAKNGPMQTLGKSSAEVTLTGEASVLALMGETITHVRRGELAPKVGQVVAQLASVGLKAIEQGEMGARVTALEERTEGFKNLSAEQLQALERALSAPLKGADAAPAPTDKPH